MSATVSEGGTATLQNGVCIVTGTGTETGTGRETVTTEVRDLIVVAGALIVQAAAPSPMPTKRIDAKQSQSGNAIIVNLVWLRASCQTVDEVQTRTVNVNGIGIGIGTGTVIVTETVIAPETTTVTDPETRTGTGTGTAGIGSVTAVTTIPSAIDETIIMTDVNEETSMMIEKVYIGAELMSFHMVTSARHRLGEGVPTTMTGIPEIPSVSGETDLPVSEPPSVMDVSKAGHPLLLPSSRTNRREFTLAVKKARLRRTR